MWEEICVTLYDCQQIAPAKSIVLRLCLHKSKFLDMLNVIIIFQSNLNVLEILWTLVVFKSCTTLSGTFQVEEKVNSHIFKQIFHDNKIPNLGKSFSVFPNDTMQSVKLADNAVLIFSKEIKVWL